MNVKTSIKVNATLTRQQIFIPVSNHKIDGINNNHAVIIHSFV